MCTCVALEETKSREWWLEEEGDQGLVASAIHYYEETAKISETYTPNKYISYSHLFQQISP